MMQACRRKVIGLAEGPACLTEAHFVFGHVPKIQHGSIVAVTTEMLQY